MCLFTHILVQLLVVGDGQLEGLRGALRLGVDGGGSGRHCEC